MSRSFPRVVLVVLLARRRAASVPDGPANFTGLVSHELVDRFTALEARENELNKTVWAKEILAEECGRVFESLWDSLNAATNRFGLLASFPVGELVPCRFAAPQALPHGIELRAPLSAGSAWSAQQWRAFLEASQRAGWELAQTEFRHTRFDTDEAGLPRQSRFYFSAHLANASRSERAVLEGDLIVDWTAKPPGETPAAVKRIDASQLTLKTRRGEPPFRPILAEQIAPPEQSYFIDPLILHDLDGDGLSEIILAAKNLIYHRRDGDRYEAESLCRYPPGLIMTGIIADFDGDGYADFLCAKFEGLVLFKGSPQGAFDQPGQLVWSVNPHLKYAQVLTCGDIDHDGDLDIFLGQYKIPYARGQMPTPYYDANDGYPSYLLLNDGQGRFTDATATAGLEKKRWRRTYSASFVDLDDDGNLDLLVVSDFAGVDLYRNDGHGHFVDLTAQWLDEPHAAGMAHAVADFDRDGLLDLLVIGMHSPTVDRLAHLGLTRPGFANDADMRAQLMHGNRLYFGQPAGGFRQVAAGDSIARSGWSWGCSAFDFDNDGFPDVYIANGHETKESVREYEPEFWLHDAYASSSKEDLVATAYFSAKMSRTRARGYSFGGYDKNRLYLNQHGSSFLEVGYLLGVALPEDCRDVVADDLDGDGRPDLLITTFEVWPETKQTLRVYKNTLTDGGNWIGFRFRGAEGREVSPVGARVRLSYPGGSAVRQIVTGDSYRSQHADTVHFGLGKVERVDRVEIRWPDRQTLTIRDPAVNRYHDVRAPAENLIQRGAIQSGGPERGSVSRSGSPADQGVYPAETAAGHKANATNF